MPVIITSSHLINTAGLRYVYKAERDTIRIGDSQGRYQLALQYKGNYIALSFDSKSERDEAFEKLADSMRSWK